MDPLIAHASRPTRADAWKAAAAWVVREGGIVEGIDYDASDFDGGAKATDALAQDPQSDRTRQARRRHQGG